MLRMGHKDNWIPFARRSLQNFQARQGKKAASAHNENIMGLGAHHILFFFFLSFFIVMQLQLYAFSPHPSTPPQVNPPPFPLSTLPLGFVYVSWII